MANRISITSSGLYISKPGVNVLTASLDNLHFSSDYPSLPVYLKASTYVNTSSEVIYYGKTFSAIPKFTLLLTTQDLLTTAYTSAALYAVIAFGSGDITMPVDYDISGYETNFNVTAYANRLTITQTKDSGATDLSYWTGYAHLIVYDFNS